MERGESEFRGSVNARVRASGMRAAKFLIARMNANRVLRFVALNASTRGIRLTTS